MPDRALGGLGAGTGPLALRRRALVECYFWVRRAHSLEPEWRMHALPIKIKLYAIYP